MADANLGKAANTTAVIRQDGESAVTEPLLGPQDVARHLGIPLATLYAWRTRGKGPRGIKVGRHLRFRQADLAAWIEANTTPTSAA